MPELSRALDMHLHLSAVPTPTRPCVSVGVDTLERWHQEATALEIGYSVLRDGGSRAREALRAEGTMTCASGCAIMRVGGREIDSARPPTLSDQEARMAQAAERNQTKTSGQAVTQAGQVKQEAIQTPAGGHVWHFAGDLNLKRITGGWYLDSAQDGRLFLPDEVIPGLMQAFAQSGIAAGGGST